MAIDRDPGDNASGMTGIGLLGAGVVGSQVARVILDQRRTARQFESLALNGVLVRDAAQKARRCASRAPDNFGSRKRFSATNATGSL